LNGKNRKKAIATLWSFATSAPFYSEATELISGFLIEIYFKSEKQCKLVKRTFYCRLHKKSDQLTLIA